MEKLTSTLLLILILCGFESCKNDLDPLEAGNYRSLKKKEKPKVKTIRMSFGGDYITESEEPLLRAQDCKTFVGVNVYYTDKDDETKTEKKYAYGLFESTNSVSINLITGYTYRFEASVLIEIEKGDKLWDNGAGNYGEPFLTNNGEGYFPESDITGEFIYTHNAASNAKFHFIRLSSGTALVDAGDALPSQYGDVRFPRVKRFYGGLNSFDPSLMSTVEIPMEYKCFGLKLVLKSIPGDTSVGVLDISDNGNNVTNSSTSHPEYYLRFPDGLRLKSTSEDSKIYDGLYSLNNFKENTKEFKLKFTWYKGNGQTQVFSHTFTVEAKKKKVLEISIDGEVDETKSGNIKFANIDDSNLIDDPQDHESVTNVNNQQSGGND